MKIVPFFCLFFVAACAPSAYKTYHQSINQYHPPMVHKMEQILATHASSDSMEHAQWAKDFWSGFEKGFNQYKPQQSIIYKLFSLAQKEKIEIVVVGGNWCSDTKRQIPRLCKVLHLAGIGADNYSYVQVDKSKERILAPGEVAKALIKPQKVPTVMIKKNGKMAGLIVETPTKSWEQDILAFLVD